MDCREIPTTDYGKFSLAIHSVAWSDRKVPINGEIELTSRCNLRCQHCYVPWTGRLGTADSVNRPQLVPQDHSCSPSASAPSPRAPMSGAEVCRILDEITDEGCFWLLITGGEPLIRSDFLDLYGHAKRKGLLIQLFTNATLMTERIADYLAEFPPFRIEVTLYGATPATYEAVTGVPGSYERCIRGIELLTERKLPLALKTMVVKANVNELPQMEAIALGYGTSFRFDHQIHPQINGCLDPTKVRLTPEERVALDLQYPKRVIAARELLRRSAAIRPRDSVFTCGAGNGGFHIDAFGRLQLCGFVPQYSYDLRQGSFRDGYHRYFSEVLGLRRKTRSMCDDCGLTMVCTTCVAWQNMEGQGLDAPVDHIHRYATLLASALGGQAGEMALGQTEAAGVVSEVDPR